MEKRCRINETDCRVEKIEDEGKQRVNEDKRNISVPSEGEKMEVHESKVR